MKDIIITISVHLKTAKHVISRYVITVNSLSNVHSFIFMLRHLGIRRKIPTLSVQNSLPLGYRERLLTSTYVLSEKKKDLPLLAKKGKFIARQ